MNDDLFEAVRKFFETRCTCHDDIGDDEEIPPCPQAAAEDELRVVFDLMKATLS